ncbi:MAG: di-trans,poly-cis-decaprenylcistransferase [Treponema sp.]|jgi:undecaprenyl diphosphate synthase|nr:di-trans,poly-cis-decaprenylcistransferase [Treponema sp.]
MIPPHIGIIMDGNGRWAKGRGLARSAGHLEGLNAAKRIVKAASDLGVRYLTLYTFSTENWKRAAEEVAFIFDLVKQYLCGELAFYRENGIRIRHAGDFSGLPPDVKQELEDAIAETAGFTGMQVILALNYGGRDEIVRAANRALAADQAGDGRPFSEAIFEAHLDNPDVPPPDLIIRTAGEFRTSNFMLWQGAYAELYVSPKFWPDWDKPDLMAAIENYSSRERKFGGVSE